MVGDATRFRFSELYAAPPDQFIDPVSVTLPSITIDFEWAILTLWSIQIGTTAWISGPRPLLRSQGVFLSARTLTSTPRCFARTNASTVLELVVKA